MCQPQTSVAHVTAVKPYFFLTSWSLQYHLPINWLLWHYFNAFRHQHHMWYLIMSNNLYSAKAPNIVIVLYIFLLMWPFSISIWICNPVRIYRNKWYNHVVKKLAQSANTVTLHLRKIWRTKFNFRIQITYKILTHHSWHTFNHYFTCTQHPVWLKFAIKKHEHNYWPFQVA
jgi:hypothetical protein